MCRDSEAGMQNLASKKDLFSRRRINPVLRLLKERNCEMGWTYINERIADFIAKDRIYLFNP